MRSTLLALLAVLASAALVRTPAPSPSGADVPPGFLRSFLHDQMGFSVRDLDALSSGRAIAKPLRMEDGRDVAIFGAVRIQTPVGTFVDRMRHLDGLERRLHIIEVGLFHDPARLEDLDGLTLDEGDLREVRRCRPDDCEVQLPAAWMARLRDDVDWRGPGASDQANRLFRSMIFEMLGAYRRGGTDALAPYADRMPPTNVSGEFNQLGAPWQMPVELPRLVHYLTRYPKADLPGAETFFYWNKGEFGMKPTTRLNQVTIYPVPADAGLPAGVRYVIATKQVYSNHYFSATLELRTLMDDPDRPGEGLYLLYTTRSRVSGLTGFIGALIRGIVRGRARSGMERYLAGTKDALEHPGASAPGTAGMEPRGFSPGDGLTAAVRKSAPRRADRYSRRRR